VYEIFAFCLALSCVCGVVVKEKKKKQENWEIQFKSKFEKEWNLVGGFRNLEEVQTWILWECPDYYKIQSSLDKKKRKKAGSK